MEYRGYDSAGIAVVCKEKTGSRTELRSGARIEFLKSVGRVNSLKEKVGKSDLIGGKVGIAHTRWATHGSPLEKNAHPHCDCKREIWVCHNGIIENYKVLKKWLIKRGHKFRSETDTEVIPHLIEEYFQGNLENALAKALKKIEGTYAIVAISEKDPNKIVAAKKDRKSVV